MRRSIWPQERKETIDTLILLIKCYSDGAMFAAKFRLGRQRHQNCMKNKEPEVLIFKVGKLWWLERSRKCSEQFSDGAEGVMVKGCIKTPRATLYEHTETPGRSIYWEPHIQGIPIPVEGTYFDILDEAIDMYTNYTKMGGFEICKEIYDETNFKERLHNIVWNMFMEPLKFEEQWAKLIEDFGLQNHKWMKKMFNLREMWILAYFIDSPLFGLMRTTSRSESENSFFKSFTSPGSTLVNFMMSCESAMERQRYRQEALDFKTLDAAPKCETVLGIERHAT
ncbi:FAR1-related sequence 5-like protein [Tanacetum coccineum]